MVVAQSQITCAEEKLPRDDAYIAQRREIHDTHGWQLRRRDMYAHVKYISDRVTVQSTAIHRCLSVLVLLPYFYPNSSIKHDAQYLPTAGVESHPIRSHLAPPRADLAPGRRPRI